jgi:hypothetical protein
MTYNLVAKHIGVDSGTILLADKDFYGKDHQSIGRQYQKMFAVEPGEYKLDWEIKTTFMGDIKGSGIINITSGRFVVSDPCYIVAEDDWDDLLTTTNYFENAPEGTIVLNRMGGDGIYDVGIVLEKINL